MGLDAVPQQAPGTDLGAQGALVPEGGIPLNVGAIVTNVETALNVLEATEGRPVTEKYVTLTGAVRPRRPRRQCRSVPREWSRRAGDRL